MKIVAYAVVALTLFVSPRWCMFEARAAMGLKCSDYLNARAHMSFDAQSGRYVAANPVGLPPVPSDVDVQVGQLEFYLSGTLESLMWIDSIIENRKATAFDLASGLEAIDRLCRKGLEVDHKDYDALDIVTLNNHWQVLKRVDEIRDLRSRR